MNQPPKPLLSPIAVWVLICTLLNAAGWILSALGQLNFLGYSVVLVLSGAATGWWWCRAQPQFRIGFRRCRFRRVFPLAFAVVAALAILGGVLHAPSNYDGLAYRTPRVLHWLAAGHWHWVYSDFPRLNPRPCGWEWVTSPLILFTGTDRLLFLINAVSFLLLPSLTFSLLTRLGVRSRVAWHWMWLFPTGYTYLLQAGSIGNDLFGSVLGMAALDFALRARRNRRLGDVWLATLAVALATASKASNLPLGLPWLIAVWPALGVLRSRWGSSALVGLLAVLVSLVPTALLNIKYCGDWSGQAVENAAYGGVPVLRLAVNSVGFTFQNFCPPIFPFSNLWNAWVQKVLPPALSVQIQRYFESGPAGFKLGEMQIEEGAGLGFGICVLLLVTVICLGRGAFRLSSRNAQRQPFTRPWLVCLGGWVAVLVLMAQCGVSGGVRYLGPYNLLLIAPFMLGSAHSHLIRRTWWRAGAGTVFAMAGLLLAANPARPLWPATWILRAAGAEKSGNGIGHRAWTVYSVYAQRADAFAPVRAILPAQANPLGFISFDDPETSLWRPFGSRRILHIPQAESAAEMRARGIKYVLASSVTLTNNWRSSLDVWLRHANGEVVTRLPLELRAGDGPKEWYLIKLY